MHLSGSLFCLLTLLSAAHAYGSNTGLWLSTNTAIASTGQHYSSVFQFKKQESTTATDSIAGDNQSASYTLDPGFSVGVRYEGAINVLSNLNLTHVPKVGFSQAVIHFPNGVDSFSSPTTIESKSFTFSEQINWNIVPISSPAQFTIGIGYRRIYNYDDFHLGSWEFTEKPSWGEVFYQAQAHIPLHKFIVSDSISQLILSIERSGGRTSPQMHIEVDF
jgi:hypothetical protein